MEEEEEEAALVMAGFGSVTLDFGLRVGVEGRSGDARGRRATGLRDHGRRWGGGASELLQRSSVRFG